MSDRVNRLSPTGNMDKDSDPRYVGKGDGAGDYLDARNIQRASPDGNAQGSVEPTLGNKFAFDLGSVSQQNKRYRITLDGGATKQHEIRFLSTQRDQNMVVGTGANGALAFNGTTLSFLSAFNAAISGSGVSWSVQVPPLTPNIIEIELASYPMYQWYMESSGLDTVEVICIAEAIPVDLAGPLKDIGSYDLLGDLFIFSTTQDNEPTEITPTIIFAGPTSGGSYVGPLTSILFNGEHGLAQGQWIRITDCNEAFLNGLFVVHSVINPFTVQIVTATAWGGVFPVTTLGTPSVFIHPSGIGEIGVAQKDENSDSWTYIRLLRSVELNFVTLWKVDCEAVDDPLRICLYTTDNYNIPKAFYYKGQFVQDGMLENVNPLNEYQFDSIFIQTLLQLQGSKIELRFKEQFTSGGKLSPGVKFYTVRQITSQGNVGPIDFVLGPIMVYSDDVEDSETNELISFNATTGITSEGYNTRKSNLIEIDNLDFNSFYEFEIICMEFIGEVFVSNIVARFNTTPSGNFEYRHTGFEQYTPIDNAETLSMISGVFQNSSVVRAKNIRNIDYRCVLSNLKVAADINIEAWTSTFRHSLVKDSITASNIVLKADYQIPETVLNDMGLMYFETYRVAARAFIRGLGWTPYGWIDDIQINTSPTNTGNPTDNRRDSTFSDYALSAGDYLPYSNFDPSSPNPAIREIANIEDAQGNPVLNWYVGIKVSEWDGYYIGATNKYDSDKTFLVPKVEFSINWSFILPEFSNRPMYEIVDAIEFGIGDSPRSVKASGLGVCSIEGGDDAGFIGLQEFPFHPKVKSSSGDFRYSGASPFNYQQISGSTIIPNYPVVYHRMDDPNAPDIEQPGVFCDQRADIISFYSPDTVVNNAENISSATEASTLVCIGSMETKKCITGTDFVIQPASFVTVFPDAGGLEPHNGYYSELHVDPLSPSGVQEVPIIETIIAREVGQNTLSNGDIYIRSDSYRLTVDDPGFDMGDVYSSNADRIPIPVVRLSAPVTLDPETKPTKQARGLIYCALYRDERSNFQLRENTSYSRIGQTVYLELFKQPSVIKVNGGDSFTSMFYHKNRDLLYTADALNSNVLQQGSMIGVVCQSRSNFNALSPQAPGHPLVDPVLTPDPNILLNWGSFVWPSVKYTFLSNNFFFWERNEISQWARPDTETHTGLDLVDVGARRSRFYDILSNFRLSSNPVASTLIPASIIGESRTRNTRPSRVIWSELHTQGAPKDELRVFLPLNLKDLDLTFGEINHHENVNGELFTLQPRKWQRQLFNTRGELQVSGNAIGAVIGDASVLSRDGQTLSRYGTQNKWSAVLGTSPGGKDVLYWFNAENGLFLRFGSDGTVVISDTRKFRSFSNKAAKWLRGKDTPAYDQGIRAVWDDRSKEAIWTFTGWRDLPQWVASQPFPISTTLAGTVVSNDNAPSDTYENLPRFFRCTASHVASAQNEPGTGPDWQSFWEQLAYDDFEYYSVFTLSHNEMTGGFSSFYGHIPKTYLKWRDSFLSSHPVHRNLLFEHRAGDYTTWYGRTGLDPKIEDAYIEMVENEVPEQSKRYVAAEVLSDDVPDRMDFATKFQRTLAVALDFIKRDDQYRTSIKNDVTTTNDPDGDSARLSGDYLKVRFTFFAGTHNVLHSIIIKMRDRIRRFRN